MRTIAAALFLFLSVAGKAQDFNYSFKESYTLTLPGQITVSSSDGDIRVVSWDQPAVQVCYIVRKMGTVLKVDRTALEKEVNLETEQDGSQLRISVHSLPSQPFFNWGNTVAVSFVIYAPRQITSQLNSSDGDITVTGPFSGALHCKTSDGDISIASVAGDAEGNTSDGNVEVDRVTGNVDVRSSDGDIRVSNVSGTVRVGTSDGNVEMEEVTGDVNARTSDGHIAFRKLSGSLTAGTSDGDIRGSMVAVEKALDLSTGDGSIDLDVPGNKGWNLSIRGHSLHVPLENFSGQADDDAIEGKVNGGGPELHLVTQDGSVRISYASN